MKEAHLTNLFHAFGIALMAGWALYLGKSILLPIVTAVLVVYVLRTASDMLSRVPLIEKLPRIFHHVFVVLGFVMVFFGLALVVDSTIAELQEVMPVYQSNLEGLIASLPGLDTVDTRNIWQDLYGLTLGRIDFQAILVRVLGGITSFGATTFMVVVYAGFLISERGGLSARIAAAFPTGEQAELTDHILRETNQRIGEYLAVKTLMNVVTGVLSFGVLWAMDVDFAIFYAVMLGVLNYIPYVGSFVGVFLPVLLSLAQFGSVFTTVLLGAMLLLIQFFVDNILEPKAIGRQMNLSPFVVLVALAVWTSLWGLPGAILAIPLTSMFVIIFDSFPATRFIAVLLSQSPATETPETAVVTKPRT